MSLVLFNMFYSALVAVFLVSSVNAYKKYVIPEPEITVCDSRGFTVSIPDEPGIRLFAFHGNINEELEDLRPGQFSADITRVSSGKWTFQEHRTRLNIGDVISFWLFVVKDGLGYRLDDGVYVVSELVPCQGSKSRPAYSRAESARARAEPARPRKEPASRDHQNEVIPDSDHTLCLQSIYNITQTLIQMEKQYQEVKEKNVQLKAIIDGLPNTKQLTISGRIPPDGEPIGTVRFILREKLNLQSDIPHAKRNADGSITFEVSSLEEKLKILAAAEEKLQSSKIFIN